MKYLHNRITKKHTLSYPCIDTPKAISILRGDTETDRHPARQKLNNSGVERKCYIYFRFGSGSHRSCCFFCHFFFVFLSIFPVYQLFDFFCCWLQMESITTHTTEREEKTITLEKWFVCLKVCLSECLTHKQRELLFEFKC